MLIGDPKQAIYAFRGADVFAYLEAAERGGVRGHPRDQLAQRRRLIDAYDALFADSQLGHEGIAYRTVQAGPGQPRIAGSSARPTRPRCASGCVHRADGLAADDADGVTRRSTRPRPLIAKDLAADVVRLLCLGGRDRRPPAGRIRDRTASRSGPATWPCWCAPTSQADAGARRPAGRRRSRR